MATLRMLFGMLVLAAGIFAGVKLIPPFISNYQFQDYLETEARNASYAQRMSEEDLRNEVFKKAGDLELPITKEQIRIIRTGSAGYSAIALSVDYNVPVDLMVYQVDLHFTPASANKPI